MEGEPAPARRAEALCTECLVRAEGSASDLQTRERQGLGRYDQRDV